MGERLVMAVVGGNNSPPSRVWLIPKGALLHLFCLLLLFVSDYNNTPHSATHGAKIP